MDQAFPVRRPRRQKPFKSLVLSLVPEEPQYCANEVIQSSAPLAHGRRRVNTRYSIIIKLAYRKCDRDPNDPDGTCLDCKARGREAECDRSSDIRPRKRHRPGHPEMEANYKKVNTEVDSLKISLQEFKNTVSQSLQHILSILLPGSNPHVFPFQTSPSQTPLIQEWLLLIGFF